MQAGGNDRNAKPELVSVRLFAAPRARVFDAFADPSRLARWWGPKGFTNVIHEFDFRPGGRWRFRMQAPDGAAFENVSEFQSIVVPEKIEFVHFEPVHRFTMTMLFAEQGTNTQLTWRMRFDDPREIERIGDFIRVANEENFDRLAAIL